MRGDPSPPMAAQGDRPKLNSQGTNGDAAFLFGQTGLQSPLPKDDPQKHKAGPQ